MPWITRWLLVGMFPIGTANGVALRSKVMIEMQITKADGMGYNIGSREMRCEITFTSQLLQEMRISSSRRRKMALQPNFLLCRLSYLQRRTSGDAGIMYLKRLVIRTEPLSKGFAECFH